MTQSGRNQLLSKDIPCLTEMEGLGIGSVRVSASVATLPRWDWGNTGKAFCDLDEIEVSKELDTNL